MNEDDNEPDDGSAFDDHHEENDMDMDFENSNSLESRWTADMVKFISDAVATDMQSSSSSSSSGGGGAGQSATRRL